MNIRIQLSRQTVKALHQRLQDAYRQDDVRLVQRGGRLHAVLGGIWVNYSCRRCSFHKWHKDKKRNHRCAFFHILSEYK